MPTAQDALAALAARAAPDWLAKLDRFGITAKKAIGVSMSDIRAIAKQYGRDHALALALWKTGVYEARSLAAFVDEPARVTSSQMDRWCKDFDNWAICDTLCFHLFDRVPGAWSKVAEWAVRDEEFVKRAAFALIAGISLHDKKAPDRQFLDTFPLIERAAPDARNFVKKGVSWALRAIGHRNAVLHAAAVEFAGSLAKSDAPPARWVGKDALRDLQRPLVKRKVS